MNHAPFVANGSVGCDQSFIRVGQNRATRRQMKENRSPAHKRFNISPGELGKAETRIIEKPSLASGPLNKWLQIVAPLENPNTPNIFRGQNPHVGNRLIIHYEVFGRRSRLSARPPLNLHRPSVHLKIDPGATAAVVRGQEQDGLGQFVRGAQPP